MPGLLRSRCFFDRKLDLTKLPSACSGPVLILHGRHQRIFAELPCQQQRKGMEIIEYSFLSTSYGTLAREKTLVI
jgi:hypothetical protein